MVILIMWAIFHNKSTDPHWQINLRASRRGSFITLKLFYQHIIKIIDDLWPFQFRVNKKLKYENMLMLIIY